MSNHILPAPGRGLLVQAALTCCLLTAITDGARSQVRAARFPIHRVIASSFRSYEGGRLLRPGINLVDADGIANAVSLPPATGSGVQIDVHVDSQAFVVVWPGPTETINRFGLGIGYAVFPRQRIRFLDVEPGRWDFTTNLPMFYPIYNAVVAAAAGGQAEGTYLGMGTNVVRTAAVHGASVRMPVALGGTSPIIVYNSTPMRLSIFPDTGQHLNRLPPNAPYSLPPGKLALFQDIGPGPDQWIGGVVDAGYTLQFQSKGGVFSPASATTYFIGQGLEATTIAKIQRMRVPRAGHISSISVTLINQGRGSGETSSLYLRKNDSEDTLLAADVKNDEIFHEVVAEDLDIVVSKGDHIEIKWVTPTWATKPTYVTINGIIYIE